MFKNSLVKAAMIATVLGSALISTGGVAAARPAQDDYRSEMKPIVVDVQEWTWGMKDHLKLAAVKPELACDGAMGDFVLMSINLQSDLRRLYKIAPAASREQHDEVLSSLGEVTLSADALCSGDASALARANTSLRSLNSAVYQLARTVGMQLKAR